MSEIKKPLPVLDGDSAFFWEGCKEGKLYIQQCDGCGKYIFYPRIVCPKCMSEEIKWIESSGKGTVYSFGIVHRSEKAFADDVPYVVALIELDEGVRMMSNLINIDIEQVKCDMPVEVVFEKTEVMTLPKFQPLQKGKC